MAQGSVASDMTGLVVLRMAVRRGSALTCKHTRTQLSWRVKKHGQRYDAPLIV